MLEQKNVKNVFNLSWKLSKKCVQMGVAVC